MSTISRDPATMPEKAKVPFSWREFGYIAAEQYWRLFPSQEGVGACTDIIYAYGMWLDRDKVALPLFQAGWDTFMVEHETGHAYKDWLAGQQQKEEVQDAS